MILILLVVIFFFQSKNRRLRRISFVYTDKISQFDSKFFNEEKIVLNKSYGFLRNVRICLLLAKSEKEALRSKNEELYRNSNILPIAKKYWQQLRWKLLINAKYVDEFMRRK